MLPAFIRRIICSDPSSRLVDHLKTPGQRFITNIDGNNGDAPATRRLPETAGEVAASMHRRPRTIGACLLNVFKHRKLESPQRHTWIAALRTTTFGPDPFDEQVSQQLVHQEEPVSRRFCARERTTIFALNESERYAVVYQLRVLLIDG